MVCAEQSGIQVAVACRRFMAQRTVSSGGVTTTLWAVVEEIDDDDEDILEVTIDVANESKRDMWDINGDIRAMDGTHAHLRGAPSRIESGGGGELKFWVPSDTGAWLFKIDYNTDSGSGSVELGPFTNDLRITATSRPERISVAPMNPSTMVDSTGENPLASAFGTALEGFGEDDILTNSVLETDTSSDDPMQAAFAGGLLISQQPPAPPSASPATPPPEQFTQPPGPPTGPPTSPPQSSPLPPGPPSGPSASPPGPPPSGSPPGPPPKSARPPGPPPS